MKQHNLIHNYLVILSNYSLSSTPLTLSRFPPYNGSSLKCMVHPSHHLSLLFQLFSISSTSPYLYVIRINLLGVTMFWGLQISSHILCHYFVTPTSTPIYFLPNVSAVISYEVQSFKCEIKKRTIISVCL